MDNNQNERLVLAYERIALALKGLHDEAKRAGNRFWPEPREQKEVILTRVENEEDRARKSLGVDDKPIEQWLTDLPDLEEDEAVIGERSRQWLREHHFEEAKKTEVIDASPEAAPQKQKGRSGAKKAKGKA